MMKVLRIVAYANMILGVVCMLVGVWLPDRFWPYFWTAIIIFCVGLFMWANVKSTEKMYRITGKANEMKDRPW